MTASRFLATITWCILVVAPVVAATDLIERQRLYDQAGEAPSITLISPDEQHFYVFGQGAIVIHAIFPAPAQSPRVAVVRRLPGLEPVGQASDAVMESDGERLFFTRRQSIVSLTRNASTGELSEAIVTEVTGQGPNLINAGRLLLSPDDRFLYALYDELLVYQVDAASGALSLIQRLDPVPEAPGGSGALALASGGAQIVVSWLDTQEATGYLVLLERDGTTGSVSGLESIEVFDDAIPFPRCKVVVLDENTLLSTHAGGTARVFRRSGPAAAFAFELSISPGDLGLSAGQFENPIVDPQGDWLYAFDANQFGPQVARFRLGGDPLLDFEDAATTVPMSASPRFFANGTRLLLASEAEDRWVLLDRAPDGALSLDPGQSYDGSPDGVQGLASVRSADIAADGSTLAARSGLGDGLLLLFDVLPDGRVGFAASLPAGGSFGLGLDSLVFAAQPDVFYSEGVGGINVVRRDGGGTWSVASSVALPFAATLLSVSPQREHLYAAQYEGGMLTVNRYAPEPDGTLGEAVVFSEALPDLILIWRSAMSRDGRFLYLSTAFGVAVLERDLGNGDLMFREHVDIASDFDVISGFAALPDGRLAVSSRDNGLTILAHGEDDGLQIVQRLEGPDRGLGYADALIQPPGSGKLYNLPIDTELPVAVLREQRDGLYALQRTLDLPVLSGVSTVVASPDGRSLYLFSAGINALSVASLEGLLDDGFEAVIVE